MATIEQRLQGRADYSTFLVHLTRNQPDRSARRVLRKILDERCLEARNPYCLFHHMIANGEEEFFNAVCFTEAPLHQIKAFIGRIDGRQIEMSPYGLVFTKDFIGAQGGNPAFYINTYEDYERRSAALRLFQEARQRGFADHPITSLLPLINIFGRGGNRRYDFYWEREWKVVGDLEFRYPDVVVGLCPERRVLEFEERYPKVKFISPRWGLDTIVTHLSGKENS